MHLEVLHIVGILLWKFNGLSYVINRLAETDTEEDKAGNLKPIFYIGETLTDEDEFWMFWERFESKEADDWIYLKQMMI